MIVKQVYPWIIRRCSHKVSDVDRRWGKVDLLARLSPLLRAVLVILSYRFTPRMRRWDCMWNDWTLSLSIFLLVHVAEPYSTTDSTYLSQRLKKNQHMTRLKWTRWDEQWGRHVALCHCVGVTGDRYCSLLVSEGGVGIIHRILNSATTRPRAVEIASDVLRMISNHCSKSVVAAWQFTLWDPIWIARANSVQNWLSKSKVMESSSTVAPLTTLRLAR